MSSPAVARRSPPRKADHATREPALPCYRRYTTLPLDPCFSCRSCLPMAAALLISFAFSYTLRAPLLSVASSRVDKKDLGCVTTGAVLGSRLGAVVASEALNRRSAAQLATAAAFLPVAANADGYPSLSIMTTEGEMTFDLWDDVAPKHVESFLKLAKQGFFDGGAFHRIIPGFVIQGGDPNAKLGYGPSGTLDGGDKSQIRKWGTGGPGYTVPAEFNPRPHEFGVLSMARANDPNSAGSQFFVCLGRLTSLDNKYTVFGKIVCAPPKPRAPRPCPSHRSQPHAAQTKGEDVLKRIASAQTVAGDIPFKRQGIERVDQP